MRQCRAGLRHATVPKQGSLDQKRVDTKAPKYGLPLLSKRPLGRTALEDTPEDLMNGGAKPHIYARMPVDDMIKSGLGKSFPGEVPERLIGPVSKTGVVARSPRVRIPPSPLKRQSYLTHLAFCGNVYAWAEEGTEG
jgi:hypothetical protein